MKQTFATHGVAFEYELCSGGARADVAFRDPDTGVRFNIALAMADGARTTTDAPKTYTEALGRLSRHIWPAAT